MTAAGSCTPLTGWPTGDRARAYGSGPRRVSVSDGAPRRAFVLPTATRAALWRVCASARAQRGTRGMTPAYPSTRTGRPGCARTGRAFLRDHGRHAVQKDGPCGWDARVFPRSTGTGSTARRAQNSLGEAVAQQRLFLPSLWIQRKERVAGESPARCRFFSTGGCHAIT